MITLIRKVVGSMLLFFDRVNPSKPTFQRSESDQALVDKETSALSLYQFKACPFCLKTRRAIERLGLKIECRDANTNAKYKEELTTQGGQFQTPCLRIENAGAAATWMYESSDIIEYLQRRFGHKA